MRVLDYVTQPIDSQIGRLLANDDVAPRSRSVHHGLRRQHISLILSWITEGGDAQRAGRRKVAIGTVLTLCTFYRGRSQAIDSQQDRPITRLPSIAHRFASVRPRIPSQNGSRG
jgi:hypothetical protein